MKPQSLPMSLATDGVDSVLRYVNAAFPGEYA